MSKKRTHKTKAEQQHLERVAALGCIVCSNLGYPDSPAIIHHIRTGQGKGQRASHFETLPLCPIHHQFHGIGMSYHDCPKTWEAKFGTELELLERVRKELGLVAA
ncbi:DUF968 domain-containing protein [Buttiauxella sp. 3AFRM03]|uniref:Ref family recombination enhancement nuclease n=1 Tax=Buttiauxella sp. 3AFRM03 TaxID=2479367 RepID=UPI000EF7D5D7|nr:Ref family recombination enhancement nuclease [Buttiauxella sp. 3AFRM03]AYN29986.1 DUF968 domain-containing protein [Buttiauxella sp. 3AFRM03]